MIRLRLFAAVAALALLVACVTQTRTVYNTLYTVQTTTQASVDGYFGYVAKEYSVGHWGVTNQVPQVSRAYDKFQAGFLVAISKVNWQSNTVAPFDVIADSLGVKTLIQQLLPAK
jgi:hypothetical protein